MYRSIQALDVYTNSLFEFDSDMPYDLQFRGARWEVNSDGALQPSESIEEWHGPARAGRIVWRAAQDDPYRVQAHLNAHLLHEDRDIPPSHVCIPLKNIEGLSSLRSAYYSNDKSQ